MKKPLDELRRKLGRDGWFAYEMLRVEVPELTPSEFKMEFFGHASEDAIKQSMIAEYTNGELAFR